MAVRLALSVVVGLAAVSGCASPGAEGMGASVVTRPTKVPVRPTVAPEGGFPTGYGEPATDGPPVK
ncbi:hypothetical protein FHX81_5589 [Saccharothrix saharensis]|uniref:Lipoprotein n=1 Tax=Saccharothrix saharensis TaxID=571190 RepID=A0A543JK73_9PSEU|nr:hypothetical protein [Saccharothrix saharensis]TQM83171.1 hypothetical protein FHX81_5589 [Saccharothrix saharensis]